MSTPKSKLTDIERFWVACKFPEAYSQFRLGMKLHPTHIDVIKSVFEKRASKVAFRAANSVGKTSSVAVACIFYAIEMLNANVVSTSATYRQILHQLIPNLKKYQHLFPNWEFLDNQIKVNGKSKYLGFATNDGAARFQGFHENDKEPLLIIVDEAAGVDDEIYQAIGRCIPTHLLVMGSPLGPEGVFYSIETDANMSAIFKHFKLTQLECLKENGYWLNKSDIDTTIKSWGNENPYVLSTVYAEFGSQIANGLLSLPELEKCYKFPPLYKDGQKHVALDFAAGGGDSNVIAFRNGNKVDIIKSFHESEPMRACDIIATELNELRDTYGIRPSDVSGDADGLGIGFVSRLKDLGWNINAFHGGSAPLNPIYGNRIAECWLEGIKQIRNCGIILPLNNEFKLQILSRKQSLNTSGKLKLESKADMKSRGIHSPDEADAILIAMSNPQSGYVTNVPQIRVPVKKYSGFF